METTVNSSNEICLHFTLHSVCCLSVHVTSIAESEYSIAASNYSSGWEIQTWKKQDESGRACFNVQ